MRTLFVPTILGFLAGACGSDPPFTWELVASAPGSDQLEVRIDGAFIVPSGSPTSELVWRLEREYRDWAHADDTIRFESFYGGELRNSFDIPARICSDYQYDCGPITNSRLVICLDAEGRGLGLCGRLSCLESDTYCGGYIASQSGTRFTCFHINRGRGLLVVVSAENENK